MCRDKKISVYIFCKDITKGINQNFYIQYSTNSNKLIGRTIMLYAFHQSAKYCYKNIMKFKLRSILLKKKKKSSLKFLKILLAAVIRIHKYQLIFPPLQEVTMN